MTSPIETLIKACGLQCERYLDREILSRIDHVDLAVEARMMTLLRGPVGSGKNLLLRLLSLQESPDAGEIWYHGKSTANLSESKRANLCNQQFGFVFANPFLLPALSVMENIATPLIKTCQSPSTGEVKARDRVEELLNFVGLPGYGHAMSMELTLGEQKRVALARALVNYPEILFGEEIDRDSSEAEVAEYAALFEHSVLQFGITAVVTARRRLPGVLPDREIKMAQGRIVFDTFLMGGSGGYDS